MLRLQNIREYTSRLNVQLKNIKTAKQIYLENP